MASDNNLIRQKVLDRLASPEQLHTLMQVTDAKGWLGLAACGVLLGTGLLWGIFGSLPDRVHASGILIHSAGLADVVAVAGGQITSLAVDVGDHVQQGAVIAQVAQPELSAEIESLRVQVGQLQFGLETSRALGSQDVLLRTSASSAERLQLESGIAASRQEQRDLQQRVLTQQELFEKGLVTGDTLLATRRQLRAAENSVKQLQAQLETSVANTFSIKRANENSLQVDQQRIQESQRQIAVLLERLQQQAKVVSNHTGRVVEVRVTVGDVVTPGMPIVSLERTAEKGGLEALMYVDSRLGKRIERGMQVKLSPAVVRRERHGVLLGEVTSVEAFPSTRQGMMRALHNESLVDTFLKETSSAPIGIRARLQPDPRTPTGYRWSSGKGPNAALSSGTRLDADITTSTQRPITLVFSMFDSNN